MRRNHYWGNPENQAGAMNRYTVVIRCKDEARWLPDLRKGLELQSVRPTAIIFVDSGSTDGSIELAESFGWSLVKYPKNESFNYSKSLNIGLDHCETEYALLLSAHCLLASVHSVAILLSTAARHGAAGVFGRQLPTSQSHPIDVRDLLTVFGREEIVYSQHPFFHNAFSLVRKDIWLRHRFDEQINGIEDRFWAKSVAAEGHKIVYEPSASVYHEHGLNQSSCEIRASRVVEALVHLHNDDGCLRSSPYSVDRSKQEQFIEYDSCAPFLD